MTLEISLEVHRCAKENGTLCFTQWLLGKGGGVQTPPPQNSKVSTELNSIAN